MEYLKWSFQDSIATITIDRPPANALSSGLLRELSTVLDEIEPNREIRVIVIHGEGRFFSAGADIKEFTTVTSSEGFSNLGKYGQDLFDRMEKFPKPIIAVACLLLASSQLGTIRRFEELEELLEFRLRFFPRLGHGLLNILLLPEDL